MVTVVIPTARLVLVLQTPDEVLDLVASLPPADRAEVSPEWIARVRSTPAGDPWALSYAAVERATGTAVGGGAFKGPPDASEVVELAYGIDPPYRGRGLATEAAAGLTGFALASGRVRAVRAHTKPDNAASPRDVGATDDCPCVVVSKYIDGPTWPHGSNSLHCRSAMP